MSLTDTSLAANLLRMAPGMQICDLDIHLYPSFGKRCHRIFHLPKLKVFNLFLRLIDMEKCSDRSHILWRRNFGREEEKWEKKSTQINIWLSVSKIPPATSGSIFSPILLETFLPFTVFLCDWRTAKKVGRRNDFFFLSCHWTNGKSQRPSTSAPQTALSLSAHALNLLLQQ